VLVVFLPRKTLFDRIFRVRVLLTKHAGSVSLPLPRWLSTPLLAPFFLNVTDTSFIADGLLYCTGLRV
jgi:hypothetical protein